MNMSSVLKERQFIIMRLRTWLINLMLTIVNDTYKVNSQVRFLKIPAGKLVSLLLLRSLHKKQQKRKSKASVAFFTHTQCNVPNAAHQVKFESSTSKQQSC